MKKTEFSIGPTPAALYGEASRRLFLYVHGLCGRKEDAEPFAALAEPLGFQTLSIDLPEHGGRRDAARLLPWEVLPELQAVLSHARTRWAEISLCAVSIGAWFSLQALPEGVLKKCLLISPLLDMEQMIAGMMAQAGVTEAQFQAAGEIPTASGQTLSWRYLTWTRQHPLRSICRETFLLRAQGDQLIPESTVRRFAEKNRCSLTQTPGGEHWFHTPEQLAQLAQWESEVLLK